MEHLAKPPAEPSGWFPTSLLQGLVQGLGANQGGRSLGGTIARFNQNVQDNGASGENEQTADLSSGTGSLRNRTRRRR